MDNLLEVGSMDMKEADKVLLETLKSRGTGQKIIALGFSSDAGYNVPNEQLSFVVNNRLIGNVKD